MFSSLSGKFDLYNFADWTICFTFHIYFIFTALRSPQPETVFQEALHQNAFIKKVRIYVI